MQKVNGRPSLTFTRCPRCGGIADVYEEAGFYVTKCPDLLCRYEDVTDLLEEETRDTDPGPSKSA